jgi:Flp pilus assembly secretin CpaC
MIGMVAKTSVVRAVARKVLGRGATVGIMGLVATSAFADDLVVKYDQSQLLRLPRPAAEIIIGNPAIADISVQAGNLLVITGKTFGITNIIALDADRNVIQDQRVLVRRDEAKVVNLQRGTQRQSYNCTPQCNPSITIGDESAYFETISKAAEKKIGFSERAAEANSQAANQ